MPQPRKTRAHIPNAYRGQLPTSNQHPVVRNLDGHVIGNPALRHIMGAAEEAATQAGKNVDELTDEEACKAIATGRQQHADDQA